MAEMSDYEVQRNNNIKEREKLFAELFKDLKELGEPFKKPVTPAPSGSTQTKRKVRSNVIPNAQIRRSRRIRRTKRSNKQEDGDYVHDSDDFSSSGSDDDRVSDPKKLITVCFPCQARFRKIDHSKDVITVWEGEDSSEEEILQPPRRRVSRHMAEAAVVLSPDEISEKDLKNIAQKSGGKTYSSERGTTCHQCRQKTLDTKTMCRSGKCVGVRGQFCGPCLKNRYGESAENALKDPYWACPPCRGLCNCSICRTREGKRPTGILVPLVKSEGYSSVKEYLEYRGN